MTDEYVTDPELLKQLNAGTEQPASEYVTDPELLKQLGTPAQPLQTDVSPQDYRQGYVAQAATTPLIGGPAMAEAPIMSKPFGPVNPVQMGAAQMKPGIAPFVAGDMAKVAGTTATDVTLNGILNLIKKEGLTGAGAEFARNALHPFTNQTMLGAAKNVGRGLAQGLTAPENLFTLPYNMSAYEQEKIRQNPYAAGLESNPYAQVQRGETQTQGRAGSANQMKSVANMPFGNVTPQERAMLEEDMRIKSVVRKKALEKVMGPVVPGSF